MGDGNQQIARDAVRIGPILRDARSGVGFQFLQGFANGYLMSLHQPGIAAQLGHDGDGFRGGDGEVKRLRPGLWVVPSAAPRSALWGWRRNLPVLGSRPWPMASNCSDFTSPERPSNSAPRPCQWPMMRSPSA